MSYENDIPKTIIQNYLKVEQNHVYQHISWTKLIHELPH